MECAVHPWPTPVLNAQSRAFARLNTPEPIWRVGAIERAEALAVHNWMVCAPGRGFGLLGDCDCLGAVCKASGWSRAVAGDGLRAAGGFLRSAS